MNGKKLIRVKEAARRFGVSTQTMRDYIASKKLPLKPVRISNRVMLDEEQVEAVLASLTGEPANV